MTTGLAGCLAGTGAALLVFAVALVDRELRRPTADASYVGPILAGTLGFGVFWYGVVGLIALWLRGG